jgi:hypothetical protein
MDNDSELLKGLLNQSQDYGDKLFRAQINPDDIHGKPLSIHWESGDTILSVTIKKFKSFFETIFDPRTYSEISIINFNYYNS